MIECSQKPVIVQWEIAFEPLTTALALGRGQHGSLSLRSMGHRGD